MSVRRMLRPVAALTCVAALVGTGAGVTGPSASAAPLSDEASLASLRAAHPGLDRLLDEGADGMTSQQIAEAQERLGASIGASGGADRSTVGLAALSANLAPSLDLLADVVHAIATGRPASATAEVGEGEEWRKRIFAALLDGPRFVLIDNINGFLDSGALASALTARMVKDRILGTSRTAAARPRRSSSTTRPAPSSRPPTSRPSASGCRPSTT